MTGSVFGKFRVVDMTSGVAGPFASKLLADYGADVIKVEPPHGDPSRQMGPFAGDDPHPEKSLLFLYLNCNKRGVTLDVETGAGRKLLLDLLKTADVLMEDYTPGYLDSLNLGYGQLEELNPKLVMTSITPFGQTGPYKSYKGNDLVYYAMGGMMYTSGAYHREPLKHGHPQSLYLGGIVTAYVTSAALFARRTLGQGQHVDLSLSEVMAADHYQPVARYAFSGGVTRRAPKSDTGQEKGAGFLGMVPAKDGYVRVSISPPQRLYSRSGPQPWPEYAGLLGHPEIGDALAEATSTQEIDEILLPVIREMPKLEYYHRLMTNEWLAAAAQTPQDLANCPQLEERQYFTEVEHPVIGRVKFPGEVVRLPSSPWNLRFPAPLLGQHNRAVFCGELGRSEDELVGLRQVGAI